MVMVLMLALIPVGLDVFHDDQASYFRAYALGTISGLMLRGFWILLTIKRPRRPAGKAEAIVIAGGGLGAVGYQFIQRFPAATVGLAAGLIVGVALLASIFGPPEDA